MPLWKRRRGTIDKEPVLVGLRRNRGKVQKLIRLVQQKIIEKRRLIVILETEYIL